MGLKFILQGFTRVWSTLGFSALDALIVFFRHKFSQACLDGFHSPVDSSKSCSMSHRALNYLISQLKSPEAGLEEKLPQLLDIFSDDLPDDSWARITTIGSLLGELKKERVLHIDSLQPLKEALALIEREDLVELVIDLERKRDEESGILQRYGVSRNVVSLQRNAIRFTRGTVSLGRDLLGAVNLKTTFKVGAVLVVGMTVYTICNQSPTFFDEFSTRALPHGTTLIEMSRGCVRFTVQAERVSALRALWDTYQDGSLKNRLQEFLVTEDIKQLANSQDVEVTVSIDEQEYNKACWDLKVAEIQASNSKERFSEKPRRHSDSVMCLALKQSENKLEFKQERRQILEREMANLPAELREPQSLETKPTKEAKEESSEFSYGPIIVELGSTISRELSKRLQRDVEAYKNVCKAFGLNDSGYQRCDFEEIITLFSHTPVKLLKDVFESLQLYDIVELLDNAEVYRRSLRLKGTMQEVKSLRKPDKRQTTYHSNVAVLILHYSETFGDSIEKIETFFKNLNEENDLTIVDVDQENGRLFKELDELKKQIELRKGELSKLRDKIKVGEREEESELRESQSELMETMGKLAELKRRLMKLLESSAIARLEMERWEEEVRVGKSELLKEKQEEQRRQFQLWNMNADATLSEMIRMVTLEHQKILMTTFLKPVHRWVQTKEMSTFFVVFDLLWNDVGQKLIFEELKVLPNKAKLFVSTIYLPAFPETLVVSSYPIVFNITALSNIFTNRWETMDLFSMMEELRRTVGVTIKIQDQLSSSIRFKKLQVKDSA